MAARSLPPLAIPRYVGIRCRDEADGLMVVVSLVSGGCNVRLMFPRLWAPFGNAADVTSLPSLSKSHSGELHNLNALDRSIETVFSLEPSFEDFST